MTISVAILDAGFLRNALRSVIANALALVVFVATLLLSAWRGMRRSAVSMVSKARGESNS